MEQEFKQYKRKGLSEMRPYVKDEDLSNISISRVDIDLPRDIFSQGFIARNPNNHADQWYVARKYFDDNLEEVNESESNGTLKVLDKIKGYVFQYYKELTGLVNEEIKQQIKQ